MAAHPAGADVPTLLRAILDEEPVGVGLLRGRDLTIVYVNRTLEDMAPKRDWAGRTLSELFPDLAEAVTPAIRSVLDSGSPWVSEDTWRVARVQGGPVEEIDVRFELRRITLDDEHYLMSMITPLSSALDGEARRYQFRPDRDSIVPRSSDAFFMQPESAAYELRRLRAIFDHLPIAVALWDPDGTVIEMSTGVERIWRGPMGESTQGYRDHEAWWADTGELVRPGEWSSQRALETGRPVYGDVFEIQRFDGTRGYVLSSAIPILDDDSQVSAVVGFVEDITPEHERARLTEALSAIDRLAYSGPDPSITLNQALRIANAALGVDSSAIVFAENGRWIVRYGHGLPEDTFGADLGQDAEQLVRKLKRSRGLVVTNDYAAVLPGSPFASESTSALFALLQAGGEATGYLSFQFERRKGSFGEQQVEFARRLAASLSLAIRNSELLASEREARKEARRELKGTRLLMAATSALASAVGLSETLQRLAEEVSRSLDVSRVRILVHDEAAAELEVKAAVGPGAPQIGDRIGEASLRAAMLPEADLRETAVMDYCADIPERVRTGAAALGAQLALRVPIKSGDTLLGVITVDEPHQRREFSARETGLLEAIAGQTAGALERATLYERQRFAARLNETLTGIDRKIHSSLEFDEILGMALRAGAQVLGAYSSSIALVRDGELIIAREFGFPEDICGWVIPMEGEPYASAALESRSPVVVEDFNEAEPVADERIGNLGIQAFIVAPLFVKADPVACLYFNFARTHRFTSEEVAFVENVSSSLSLALENAELYRDARERGELGQALSQIDEDLAGALEIGEMTDRALELAVSALDADRGAFAVLETNGWRVTTLIGPFPTEVGERVPLEHIPQGTAALETHSIVAIDDTTSDPRVYAERTERLGIAAVLVVPVFRRGDPYGIALFGCDKPQPWSPAQKDFAEKLGLHLSLSARNAELYRTERTIAETLQETLLVMPTRVRGIRFARFYRSATEATRVGGDFIDAFELTGRRVGFALGDVAGKGVEAATITGMVRNTLRAYMVEGLPPSAIAHKTNQLLNHFTPVGMFVTAIFGVLDPRTGRIDYVNAGHPPACIIGADGERRYLTAGGPVVGAFGNVRYQNGHCSLGFGECLVAYSDGVTEARRDRELYGEERLDQLLSELAGRTPSEVVTAVFTAIDAFAGGRLRDDVALLAFERDGVSTVVDQQPRLDFES